jgi:16S rRNA (guanine(966)-N(2))-methyltransferase RsmD
MKKTNATRSEAARSPPPRRAPAPGRVRIIGGRYRRTPIEVVSAPGLRPTPDRVRETLFNWLEHQLGDWSAAEVLDLYAGSGALGFECASRGARRVTLVENQPRAAAALRRLQQRLASPAVSIVEDDALRAAARMAPASVDLVFLDPPYESGQLGAAMAAAARVLRAGGLLYVEGGRAIEEPEPAATPFEPLRAGRAGAVHFHLLRARSC